MNKKIPLGVLIIVICGISCVKNDLKNIDGPSYYAPQYSLPIGEVEVVMEDLVDEHSGSLLVIPDSVSLPDSVSSFVYNSVEYYNPLVFYYIYETNYDFSSLSENFEYITSLMFRTNCINGIPASAKVQVYFYDEAYNFIDSLYKNKILTVPASSTNGDGEVTEDAEVWKFDTYIDTANIQRLEYTKHIIIAAKLNISEVSGKNIQYSSEQKLWFQLGLRIGLEIPL